MTMQKEKIQDRIDYLEEEIDKIDNGDYSVLMRVSGMF